MEQRRQNEDSRVDLYDWKGALSRRGVVDLTILTEEFVVDVDERQQVLEANEQKTW